MQVENTRRQILRVPYGVSKVDRCRLGIISNLVDGLNGYKMIPRKDGLEIEGRGMIKLEDAIVEVVVKRLNVEMLKKYFERISRRVGGTETEFVIVDHAETARDRCEAGGSERKKIL